MKRCVVFDIDDTLYLERDYVLSGFQAVGRWVQAEYKELGFAETAWELFLKGHRGNTFDIALGMLGLPDTTEVVSTMVGVYREHRPDIALLPDARECLDKLRDDACLGVITDGALVSQQRKAAALQLSKWIAKVVFTAELGPGFGKPHPRAFEEMQDHFDVEAERCTYVADNPQKDFLAPNRLGWNTLRVVREGGIYARIGAEGDHEARSTVTSLLEALQRGLL